MPFLDADLVRGNIYDIATERMCLVACMVGALKGMPIPLEELMDVARLLTDAMDETAVFGLAEIGTLEANDPRMKVAVAHTERWLDVMYGQEAAP